MVRGLLLLTTLAATSLTACEADAPRAMAAAAPSTMPKDNFDKGLCIAPCPQAAWQDSQQIRGSVQVQRGVLVSSAAPRRGEVPKAGLIARIQPVRSGRIDISFDVRFPSGTPLNSIHLLDLECATCGLSGNPGIRMYLRDGRLRIDRSKIGIEHAWTNDSGPQLLPDRWHRIDMNIELGRDDLAGVQVALDGQTALQAQGATMLQTPGSHVDRIQFGITATSNDVPVRAEFDNFSSRIVRR